MGSCTKVVLAQTEPVCKEESAFVEAAKPKLTLEEFKAAVMALQANAKKINKA